MIRLAPLLLLAGCDWFEPKLEPISTAPQLVDGVLAWELATGASQPTDLCAWNGGLAVLDGLGGTVRVFDADRNPGRDLSLADLPFRAVRLAPAADGGLWLTAPTNPTAVHLDAAGRITARVEVHSDDGAPVSGLADLVDRGTDLVVALADGGIAQVDRATGAVQLRRGADLDGVPLTAPVHLALDGDDLLVTDTLGPTVTRWDSELVSLHRLGRRGMRTGTLGKPKAAAPSLYGTIVVADSALDALQVFDADGQALGVVALDGERMHLAHAIAAESLGEGTVAVLDSATGTVRAVRLGADALQAARDEAEHWRHLNPEPLVVSQAERLGTGELCRDCHDGTVLDHRQNWEPSLAHHPVGVPARSDASGVFPLDEQGRIECTTCHSPHGTVSLVEANATPHLAPLDGLVRHAPTEGDQFTRLSRHDAELCVACHGDAAHETALAALAQPGSAHPTGAALDQALAKRGGRTRLGLPAGLGDSCLGCHDVHGAARAPLLHDAAASVTCAGCHPDAAHRPDSHPARGRGLGEGCMTCHDLVGGATRALLADRPCTTCHEPLTGVHAGLAAADGGCDACHDLHGAPTQPLLAHPGQPADPASCLSCHGPGGRAAAADVHPGSAGHPVTEALPCTSCHSAHGSEPPPECASCHADHAGALDHGSATCTDCHPVHQAAPTAAHPVHPRSDACLGCHGPEAAGPTVRGWVHPTPVFRTEKPRWDPLAALTLYDADGAVLPADASGVLACTSCHTTHAPPAGADALVRPEVERACAACHGGQAAAYLDAFHRRATR